MEKRRINRKVVQFVAAYLLVIFGIGLMAVGMMMPPLGYIDPTVLTAFGEIATFAGAMMGMDYHYRSKGYDQHGEKEP